MIEQTELIITKWQYQPPLNDIEDLEKLTSYITLDVMRKRTATKKGIACRFTCEYVFEQQTVLEYVAEHSYVIDLADKVDREELQTMIKNTYSKFKEKFDFKKLGTVLQNTSLIPFNEKTYDLEPVLLLII